MDKNVLSHFSFATTKNFRYIEQKYHCIIPEYNKNISPKYFIKIFKKNENLGLTACYIKWDQSEIDKFIKLLNEIPVNYLHNILLFKPEIFKTNILKKIDAHDVSFNPERYYKLYLQLKDGLFDLYEIFKKQNSNEVGSYIYLASLYCGLGFEIHELARIINIINENRLEMEFIINEIKDKDTLVNLLNLVSANKIDKCVEMLNFMKENKIRQIKPEFFSMILNHTNKVKLAKKIKENSLTNYITIKGIYNYTEREFQYIQNDYIKFTPFDEIAGIKNIDSSIHSFLLEKKIIIDLLGIRQETIYSFYTNFKDIQEIAKKYEDNEMLQVMDMLNSLRRVSPTSKEYKRIYDEYKNKINIGGTQLLRKFKEYYCHKINDGLFDPKKIPDEEGEYEKYKVEYINYYDKKAKKTKKIKKIVLWDPNFYMDVSNIIN